MIEIVKNYVGRFREVFSFHFDYKTFFLSLTVLCECSAKGRGQVWPGLSCPALVPLSPNDLVTSPRKEPWKEMPQPRRSQHACTRVWRRTRSLFCSLLPKQLLARHGELGAKW